MAYQFVVKKNGDGGYDLWLRGLMTMNEYQKRFNYMVLDCGLSPEETAKELYAMHQFVKKNVSNTNTFNMCRQYVFDFVSPGDIGVVGDQRFIVQNQPQRIC